MVKVKSLEEISRRYVMGSIECFLRGEKSLNWIMGVIRSSGIKKTALQDLFASYRQSYAENTAFQALERSSKQLGYI
jgi:hypothetical protein